jgi:hypothetical protein
MALADLLGIGDGALIQPPRPAYGGFQFDLPQAPAAAAAPQAAQAQAPHQPSKLRNFLGAIGDALLVAHGQQPLYRQRMDQQRQQQALQGFLTNPDQAIAQLMQVDAPSAVKLYTELHQKQNEPELVQELRAAGIDPTSDQGRQILVQHLGASGADPASVREYQFAKGQGFAGSYLDFLNQRGGPLIANNGDGTFTIVPRAMVGGQPSAAPSGAPAVGSVEDGYRFKGGDPSKQENWEPVQGGATASAPSLTFR